MYLTHIVTVRTNMAPDKRIADIMELIQSFIIFVTAVVHLIYLEQLATVCTSQLSLLLSARL